jgi:pSer/pThr/pTyr-binding forkhead associated (FHA) protein
MARLLIKTAGLENQLIELKLGTNRIGRSPDNDFQILHATISSLHCELVLTDGGVLLRDLESTNGTSVDGKPVREAQLVAGQTVHLGDVELFVETTEAKVVIPKFFHPELPAPPVVTKNGAVICPRHPHIPVTHQCTVCKEVMCEGCVHRLRRKGGKVTLSLCPICSNAVELIGEKKQKKKSLLSRVGETVKLKFTRVLHVSDEQQ